MKRRKFIHNSVMLSALTVLPYPYLSCDNLSSKKGQKVSESFPLATKAMEGFEKRRMLLLENTAERNITTDIILNTSKDLFSNRAIANMVLHRFIPEANKRIQHTARWFEHPHPNGRDQKWECDFAAIKLCRASYLFRNSSELEKETRESINNFFLTRDFKSVYGSENHELQFRVSRYLMAQLLPDKMFMAYGKKGELLKVEDAQWLKEFIWFRAKQGWGEFDSSGYYVIDVGTLVTLFDYTEDKELKHLTEMILDLLLADISVDSLNGMYCGAHGRIYPPSALDHSNEPTFPLQYLYFGMITPEQIAHKGMEIDTLVSGYVPKKILIELALDRSVIYENLERKHLHNVDDIKPEHPLQGSIRKYTYYTPQYVMGCVQYQDPYPDIVAKWYAFHEQHDWDLSFAATTRTLIFTSHPGNNGNEHNYWTGDLNCGCGHFFQNKTALICLYDIPAKEPYQLIHAYLPGKEFDEVIEIDHIIFVRSQDSYAALKLLGGHKWTTQGEWKDKEVISEGGKNGAICEVGNIHDFGSFKKFQDVISANKIDFDSIKMELTYDSKNAGKLTMNTKDLRMLNDKQLTLDYPSFSSPYMESEWKSGLITISKNGEKMVLDFRK
jgi:hypothetical protein